LGELNYTHPPTIQCYDCHDSHDNTSIRIDAVPEKSGPNGFSSNHYPQNIAFGFTKTGLGSMTEDAPAGSVPGYYENKPPYALSPSTYYGADPNLNPDNNVQLLKTGGHYFKYVDPDGGSSAFRKGDKLPCRDCHDPHAWDSNWQAFFRRNWPTMVVPQRLGTQVGASIFMANDTGIRDTGNGGRILCTACHGTSNGTPVNFSDINGQYTSVAIVKPPASIAEHASADTTPCVSCHNHNSIDVSCGECHGNPPPQYPPGKNPDNVAAPSGAYAVTPEATHAIHFGKQNGSETAFSKYSFPCKICHANSAMGTKTPPNHGNDNVDIDFDFSTLATTRSWIDNAHPAHFQPFTGSTYVRATCGPGGRGGVYCHSDGHDNTAATGYYKNVTWGTAPLACSGCHGNSSYNNGNLRYGMPDKLDHANSHERHVVGSTYECSVCHFNTVTGTSPGTRAIKGTTNAYHVNGNLDVSFDPAVATGGYTIGTKTCSVSCHGAAQVWGTTLSNGCFGCHFGTEVSNKPQDNVGIPNPVDNTQYLTRGHGRPQASGAYPLSNNPAAHMDNVTGSPSDCYYCHSQTALHTPPDRVNDPWRLGYGTDTGGQKGTLKGAFADNITLLCLKCHGSATDRSGIAEAATSAVNAQTHARGITGTKYATWPVNSWKCVDCHDPHGDANINMIRSGINAPNSSTDTQAGSDPKGRTLRIDANVHAITFTDNSGYAANSYAISGAGTWGICEVCHTQTAAYAATGTGTDNAGTHATRTGTCTTCHPHSSGFAATACRGCHGPDGVATGAPEIARFWTSSGHGRLSTGSPSRPIECEDCHDTSYLTSSDHKTYGVPGSPPHNINTLDWPPKSPRNADTNPNANTAHLKSGYINASPLARADVARTFDSYCVTACHDADYHRHWKDGGTLPRDVMRFGDHGTRANPKLFLWYTWDTTNPANYPTYFYQSRSVWIDNDIRSVSGMTDQSVNYGLCVSCHDPHGTGVTDTSGYSGWTPTNHMLRGNWLPPAGPGTFCNSAGCHG